MQLEKIHHDRHPRGIVTSVSHLKALRRQYVLVYRAVELANRRFGFILLLHVCFIFISTITNVMFIWVSLVNVDWSMLLLYTILQFDLTFQLFVMATVSDKTNQAVKER